MTRLVTKVLFCVSLVAATAQAGITTSNLTVRVTGNGIRCGELKDVYLIINGNDLGARWVPLRDGVCEWIVDLKGDTISTSIAKFSLRFGLKRSGCQMATAKEEGMTANLVFSCCAEGPFRNLSVKTEPPMPVSYGRDVKPFPEDLGVPVQCLETATFAEGRGAIHNALFTREHIYLDLGPLNRKRVMLGLLLNSMVVDDGTLILTLDDVTYRLMVQRANGKMRSVPTLSSNAISLDIKKLEKLKFERAEFEVIK
jgi:hypothetical protein